MARTSLLRFALLLTVAAPLSARAPAPAPASPEALRDAALGDDTAWTIAEGLTTEVGPRLAGTEAEARARDWAVARLKALGFRKVRIEPFSMPAWVRGEEEGAIVSPFPQPLRLTALGNSAATPAKGMEGEVAYFPTLADLQAAPAGQVKGKIAFISHAMHATQDGSSYGAFGAARFIGPRIAAEKGAAAVVIRSIGTDHHRVPHTGATTFGDTPPIPAAALSVPDAEQLERVLARGKPVRLRLLLTPRQIGTRESGNVIAEVPGSDPDAGIVLVGGHLDSWDLGTGAIDDAAGLAITTAAAKRLLDAGTPRRTIRVVWFGAEEVGVLGGKAYAEAHQGERHSVAAESDFGADRIWSFAARVAPAGQPAIERLARALAPLGIAHDPEGDIHGSDVEPMFAHGAGGVALRQSGIRYFDLHHTADDTLDKIDRDALRQNVAAWTTMLAILANAPEPLGSQPQQSPAR